MKVRKNCSSGFSIIEVTMALTITALGLTTLFITQGRVLQQVARSFSAWQSIVLLKNHMYATERTFVPNASAQQSPSKTTTVDDVALTTTVEPLQENSALQTLMQKNQTTLHVLRARASWNFFGIPYRETMIAGFVVPPPQEQRKGNS